MGNRVHEVMVVVTSQAVKKRITFQSRPFVSKQVGLSPRPGSSCFIRRGYRSYLSFSTVDTTLFGTLFASFILNQNQMILFCTFRSFRVTIFYLFVFFFVHLLFYGYFLYFLFSRWTEIDGVLLAPSVYHEGLRWLTNVTPVGFAFESLLANEFNDPLGARPYTIKGDVSQLCPGCHPLPP